MNQNAIPTTLNQSLQTAAKVQKKNARMQRLLQTWQQRLRQHQNIRLLTALVFASSLVVLSMLPDARSGFAVPALLLMVFIVLVVRTRRIHRHVQRLVRWSEFLQRQHRRLLGQPSGRSWKQAFDTSVEFPLIRDLGLVGAHSLWTLVDETLSEGGLRRLLDWMSRAPVEVSVLKKRQEQIRQLRSQVWFYTRLGLETNSNDLNLSTLQIQEFLKKPFVGSKFNMLLLANLGLWGITVAMVIIASKTGMTLPSLLLMAFPLVSLVSLGSVGAAFLQGTGLSHHLSALAPVLESIEKKAASNKTLKELCPKIFESSPSRTAQKLETILGFLGTQTNPILHFVLNAILPWTVVSIYFLERLRKQMEKDFPACVEELSEFEVLGSLLIFDKYQTQCYPEFSSDRALKCRNIFHPLLDRNKAVANDFAFPEHKSLGLLTGSNMSGKSTFLRTLGVNQTLANMGAPVFADHFVTLPLQIETCIEVSDSLRDGYSYFYAEVRRLKDILKTAASGKPVLYLIDEIFRGTNNRERQIGSRAVIQTLAQEKSALGFISTHDLELTTLENSNPTVLNLHFREDIDDNGKMIFHYHLRTGPCPTTNALRIMAAEGIKVDDI